LTFPSESKDFLAVLPSIGEEGVMILLEVTDLSKEFDGLRALDRVSFSAEDGEILGVIGPNGAGKTTLFNLLSIIRPPVENRLHEIILHVKPHQISRLGENLSDGRPFSIWCETNILVAFGHPFYPFSEIDGVISSSCHPPEVQTLIE
jgi:energy-coupling factor transporter ATP-binding protein EcfA2